MEPSERPTNRSERFARALFTDPWIWIAALAYVGISGLVLLADVRGFRMAVVIAFPLYAAFAIWRALRASK